MVFTIEEIKKRIIPIVVKYGINSFSLFGSYARDEATEDSDLDFVMDKGDLKGLQYVSLVQDLEDEFNSPLNNQLIHYTYPFLSLLQYLLSIEVLQYLY